MATFLQIRKRVNYLIGETNYGTKAQNAIINDHILASVQDIVRMYPYSWNLKTSSGALASGVLALTTGYLPTWHLEDVRVTTSASSVDDLIFTEIKVRDRDQFTSTDYIYWLTNTAGTFSINSLTQTGYLDYFYYSAPTDMSGDTDVCAVPDGEAVAYLAASKMYVGDERVKDVAVRYEQEAMKRIDNMYIKDLQYGVDMKSSLNLLGEEKKKDFVSRHFGSKVK